MKISDMTNAQATEALVRLSGPFAEICDDDDALAIVDEYKQRYGKPLFYTLGKVLPPLVTHIMVKHHSALNEIVSVLADVPVSKVDGMNFAETIGIIRDSWDDTLRSFFPSSGAVKRRAGDASA